MADISNELVISEIGKKTLKEVTEWLILIMKENYLTLQSEKAVELSVKKCLAKHALLTKSKHRQKGAEAPTAKKKEETATKGYNFQTT